jgi:hypothetical protein
MSPSTDIVIVWSSQYIYPVDASQDLLLRQICTYLEQFSLFSSVTGHTIRLHMYVYQQGHVGDLCM